LWQVINTLPRVRKVVKLSVGLDFIELLSMKETPRRRITVTSSLKGLGIEERGQF
jgi:hypothetical protein